MGNLLARLWQAAFGAAEFKIVFVGLNNAGKTTVVYRLSLGQVVATTPTIGSNVEEFTHGNVKFLVWDVGGQEALRSTWTTYYANARVCATPLPPSVTHGTCPRPPHPHPSLRQALVFVVDSTDRERIDLARDQFHIALADEVCLPSQHTRWGHGR